MKFALTLCFAACCIATLQAAAVEPSTTQAADELGTSTAVLNDVANDYYSECNQPRETGRCFGLFRRYAYNVERRRCEEFIYGGCGGNQNNFASKADCEATCTRHYDEVESSTTLKAGGVDEVAPEIPVDEKPAVVA